MRHQRQEQRAVYVMFCCPVRRRLELWGQCNDVGRGECGSVLYFPKILTSHEVDPMLTSLRPRLGLDATRRRLICRKGVNAEEEKAL